MKIVLYRPESCSPPRAATSQLNLASFPTRVILKPGKNSVSDEVAARIEAHPSFAKYKDQEALAISDPPVEPSPSDSTTAPENLSHLNTDEAGSLIDKTENIELLQKWLKAETRKTTRGDLDRRIKELTEA